MSTETEYKIRQGTCKDAPILLQMIKELSAHLKVGPVKYDEKHLADCLNKEYCYALLAESVNDKRCCVGYILYYYGFSAPSGRFLFMEDFYVRPECRSKGIGTALWRHLAQIAVKGGHEKLEWQVLDWNVDAVKLYKKMGGIDVQEVFGNHHYMLNKECIHKLAQMK